MYVATYCGDRLRLEKLVLRFVLGLTGRAVVNFVQAQVILAALQQRESRRAGQCIGERVDQLGQIAIDQLSLQGDRRGGHHDRRVIGDRADNRRNKVSQRLSGAGSRLHRQVLAGFEGVGNRGGHLQLAAAFAAAQRRHRGGQQLRHRHRQLVGRGYSCWSMG